MKAKDTIMSDEQLAEAHSYPNGNHLRRIAQTQAEITFALGEEQGIQKGRREVVEWVKEHSEVKAEYTDDLHLLRSYIELPSGLWQAKLKEWGIEE